MIQARKRNWYDQVSPRREGLHKFPMGPLWSYGTLFELAGGCHSKVQPESCRRCRGNSSSVHAGAHPDFYGFVRHRPTVGDVPHFVPSGLHRQPAPSVLPNS
jgi:hypothetical protein